MIVAYLIESTPGGYGSRLAGYAYSFARNATSAETLKAGYKQAGAAVHKWWFTDLTYQLHADGVITHAQFVRWLPVRPPTGKIDWPCVWAWLEHAAATIKAQQAKTRSAAAAGK